MTLLAPVLLVLAAVAIITGTGVRHRWRRTTILWAGVSMLLVGGMFEVLVFLIEFSIDGCGAW